MPPVELVLAATDGAPAALDLGPGSIALVLLAGFAAGFLDAVVGGGGVIQLPALLLIPGIAPVQALATNKLGSLIGTVTSAITYLRRTHPDLRTAVPMALFALVGAAIGASFAASLPAAVFTPIIVIALIAVAVFTAARPSLGAVTRLRYSGAGHLARALGLGLVIGAYDGLLGPGTGTFLVISLVSVIGYDFLRASATAKIVNVATNIGALALFIPHGAVLWGLGLALGVANMVGAYLGARVAIARGARFVRIAFLIVSTVLIVSLIVKVWQEQIVPLFG